MFALVTIQGKQYKVAKGAIVDVDRIKGKEGDTVVIKDVLLASDGGKTTFGNESGTPKQITAKIVRQFKGDKVEVRRFKSKVRYRRQNGFRPSLTRLEVVSVG